MGVRKRSAISYDIASGQYHKYWVAKRVTSTGKRRWNLVAFEKFLRIRGEREEREESGGSAGAVSSERNNHRTGR